LQKVNKKRKSIQQEEWMKTISSWLNFKMILNYINQDKKSSLSTSIVNTQISETFSLLMIRKNHPLIPLVTLVLTLKSYLTKLGVHLVGQKVVKSILIMFRQKVKMTKLVHIYQPWTNSAQWLTLIMVMKH